MLELRAKRTTIGLDELPSAEVESSTSSKGSRTGLVNSWKAGGLGLDVPPMTLKFGLEVAPIFSAMEVNDDRDDNLLMARPPWGRLGKRARSSEEILRNDSQA